MITVHRFCRIRSGHHVKTTKHGSAAPMKSRYGIFLVKCLKAFWISSLVPSKDGYKKMSIAKAPWIGAHQNSIGEKKSKNGHCSVSRFAKRNYPKVMSNLWVEEL